MSTPTQPKDSPKDSRMEQRYIFIGGGGAAGGWLTNLGPDKNIDIPIPTVAPVYLPEAGGISEASVVDYSFRYTESQLQKAGRKQARALIGKEFLYIGSAASSTKAGPEVAGRPRVVKTSGEAKAVRIDGRVFVEQMAFTIDSSSPSPGAPPAITIAGEFPTLTLDGFTIDLDVDTKAINSVPTYAELEKTLKNKKLPSAMTRSLTVDSKTGGLYRNASNYSIVSIVKGIKGKLPPGAYVEPNGYIIVWPDFGKIVLGEVIVTPYMRRLSMLRLKRSEFDLGGGCGGGSDWP